MSKKVEVAPVAVVEEAGTALATKTKKPSVVDRGLVAQLVGDAQRRARPWTGRAVCWPS
ncbi:hypothetical protein [Microbacterium sp.]|uniref:hypothetical protein n=1 Tax=Microbacterium sp. TaxID=51671 RepID=UPI003A91D8A1